MATKKVVKGLLKYAISQREFAAVGIVRYYSKPPENSDVPFDTRMLDVLACPLSKKPLRYDAANNELVCDELGVAYPIVRGIPNLNPQDGRMIKKPGDGTSSSTTT